MDSVKSFSTLQKAIDGCDGDLYIDPGIYPISADLIVPAGLYLHGAGRLSQFVVIDDAVVSGIKVTSDKPVIFEKFTMACMKNHTSVLINASPPGIHNENSIFRDLTLTYGRTALHLGNAVWWTIDSCTCYGQVENCVFVESVSAPDDGDCCIVSCTLSYPGYCCILQRSAGGLKIIGNKLIGAGSCAYLYDKTPGANTSDLIAVGNSVENCRWGFAGHQHLSNVVLESNQFANVEHTVSMP